MCKSMMAVLLSLDSMLVACKLFKRHNGSNLKRQRSKSGPQQHFYLM